MNWLQSDMIQNEIKGDWSELPRESLAVLVSGGLDSAILLAESLRFYKRVFPIYIQNGLHWENTELVYLGEFLQRIATPALGKLTVLQQPIEDVYGVHWSTTGENIPDANSADDAVFLPGRNILLLTKSIIWCHLHKIDHIALAPLGSNPFPDATPAFFREFSQVMNQAIMGKVKIIRPYGALNKVSVLQIGRDFPLEWTFSCIQPIDGVHCGCCNKCAERKIGFQSALMTDPTVYKN